MDLTLTYEELAERLNTNKNAARVLVQRKGWTRTTGNDGKARVRVPADYFDQPREPRAASEPPHDAGARAPHEDSTINALQALADNLRETLEHERTERHEERERLLADLVREREERIRVLDQAAGEREAIRADYAAARARLEADVDRLRAELRAAVERADNADALARRPWWRRLLNTSK